jgi:hypothetical protein
MALQDRIFSYCERGQDPALWAEPLNAASNLAFIAAAGVALTMLLNEPRARRGGDHYLLVALVFAIGIGSFLFHIFANRWSVLADVIPITLFILVYLAFALNRFAGVPVGWTVLLTAAYMGLAQGASPLKCRPGLAGEIIGFGANSGETCLNGSIGYVPALIALFLVGGVLLIQRHPAARDLLIAGSVLAVSLTLRTIDQAVCAETVIAGAKTGTHFLWHILNSVTLYLLLRAAIRHGPPVSAGNFSTPKPV